MIIRATTDSDKKKGDVTIEVKVPEVVMTGASKLTENFKTGLEFQVIDPRDNSIIDEEIYFSASLDYISYSVMSADDTDINIDEENDSGEITSEDDMFKATVFVEDVNWDQLEKDEKDATVSLMMKTDGDDVKLLSIPVGEASLTSDPDKIIMNAGTNLTLTYLDAEGMPLEGYDIDLGDDEIGETDENGQVIYSTAATSSVALTFKADTDDKHINGESGGTDEDKHKVATDDDEDTLKTELKVKSGADVQPPVVTYEVTGNSAIITITDNVRISKSMVNGELVDMFFPMPSVSHVVTGLKVGENKIEVLSGDINNNFLQTTLVITLEPMAEPVEFTIGEETTYGTPVLMSDITMVPVRFAQDLGATVEWDNDTQTVTYTLGEIKVAMTIGSTTAIVNDSNVQLAVAPYKNELGRTMVPLRMIAQELGFTVEWTSNDAPIMIK